MPYPYNKENIGWENYAHDIQHTGRYVNPEIKSPVVESINPNSDSYRGGKIVEIKGRNFMEGAKVFFDGIRSEYVQVADSNTIYAKVPPLKSCNLYINDISISPYTLSEDLVNQPLINRGKGSVVREQGSEVRNQAINQINQINETKINKRR
mgnify:CR=1 FL=1